MPLTFDMPFAKLQTYMDITSIPAQKARVSIKQDRLDEVESWI